jgi:hypothetical protein
LSRSSKVSISNLADSIELACFHAYGGLTDEYRDRLRSIRFNIKENRELGPMIISSVISPEALATLPVTELASKDTIAKRYPFGAILTNKSHRLQLAQELIANGALEEREDNVKVVFSLQEETVTPTDSVAKPPREIAAPDLPSLDGPLIYDSNTPPSLARSPPPEAVDPLDLNGGAATEESHSPPSESVGQQEEVSQLEGVVPPLVWSGSFGEADKTFEVFINHSAGPAAHAKWPLELRFLGFAKSGDVYAYIDRVRGRTDRFVAMYDVSTGRNNADKLTALSELLMWGEGVGGTDFPQPQGQRMCRVERLFAARLRATSI